MRQAGQTLKNYRLVDASLYVTLEPCWMCLAAMAHARVTRLVFGAYDLRVGCTQVLVSQSPGLVMARGFSFKGGVLEPQCRQLMQDFFRQKRCGKGYSSSDL